MVERQFERVAHVVADRSRRAAERRDETDLDAVGAKRGLRQRQSHRACQPECLFHIHSPPHYLFVPPAGAAAVRGLRLRQIRFLVPYFVREIPHRQQARTESPG
jgi:hypothetical protein